MTINKDIYILLAIYILCTIYKFLRYVRRKIRNTYERFILYYFNKFSLKDKGIRK